MFTDPLGLLALLGVPAVVALHLFRRRFRPHAVSALFLWHDGQEVLRAGRRLERLRPTTSFVCEVLAALLLGLALAGPRACAGRRAQHLVCVLDGSASMRAAEGGESAADRARALVGERLDDLPSGSRVTLIRSGRRPRVLSGPAAFPAAAREALEGYDPREPGHELAPAAALALELAGDAPVLVVTDHFVPGELPTAIELVAVGQPVDNVALEHVARLDDGPGGGRVFATVVANTVEEVERELVLRAGERELARRPLRLAPGARETLRLELPPDTGPVELRLTPDALGLDDVAVLAPPPVRTLRVARRLEPGLERALGLDADRLARALPDVREATPDGADLLLTDADAAAPEAAATLVLHPGDPGGERLDLAGPFVVERGHPLGAGLVLEGVVWSRPREVSLPGTPLVSAASLPLVTEEERDGRRVVHVALDPLRSSVQRSPDWPVLLANLVELARAALPGPQRTNLTLGEELVHVAVEPTDYVLRDPDGDVLEEAPGRRRFQSDRFERPGLHTLEADGRVLCTVGVRFADPLESDLLTSASDRREGLATGGDVLADRSRLATWLAALALALVLADWIALRRTPLVAARRARAARRPA